MKNIFATLKNLVTAKKENQNETSAEPVSASSASLRYNSPAPPRSDASTLHDFPISSSRRPNGKVAHLPKIIRDQVNQMLDDGVTFRKIAKKLTELGHPGFFYQNIQRWKTGGYQLHLQEQRRRELDKLELEAALDRLAADPNAATTLAEANEIKLALKNSRLLNQIHD